MSGDLIGITLPVVIQRVSDFLWGLDSNIYANRFRELSIINEAHDSVTVCVTVQIGFCRRGARSVWMRKRLPEGGDPTQVYQLSSNSESGPDIASYVDLGPVELEANRRRRLVVYFHWSSIFEGNVEGAEPFPGADALESDLTTFKDIPRIIEEFVCIKFALPAGIKLSLNDKMFCHPALLPSGRMQFIVRLELQSRDITALLAHWSEHPISFETMANDMHLIVKHPGFLVPEFPEASPVTVLHTEWTLRAEHPAPNASNYTHVFNFRAETVMKIALNDPWRDIMYRFGLYDHEELHDIAIEEDDGLGRREPERLNLSGNDHSRSVMQKWQLLILVTTKVTSYKSVPQAPKSDWNHRRRLVKVR